MTNDISLFTSISSFFSPTSILTTNSTPMSLAGVGSIMSSHLSLSDVYCILQLALNLILISQLCDSRYSVNFSSTSCYLQDPR